MEKFFAFILSLTVLGFSTVPAAPVSSKSRGAELFERHCTACHPDAARIKADANIVAFMREPVPPMPAFRSEKISEADAQAIAAFIKVRIYCARAGKNSL